MKKVLFICVHNSGRSQMAEALFNYYAPAAPEAQSAGTMAATSVNPIVIEVMNEKGIDISSQQPKMLTDEMLENSDKVITMGCGVEGVCPATFVQTEDWALEDPEGKSIEEVRGIRDLIESKVKKLIVDLKL